MRIGIRGRNIVEEAAYLREMGFVVVEELSQGRLYLDQGVEVYWLVPFPGEVEPGGMVERAVEAGFSGIFLRPTGIFYAKFIHEWAKRAITDVSSVIQLGIFGSPGAFLGSKSPVRALAQTIRIMKKQKIPLIALVDPDSSPEILKKTFWNDPDIDEVIPALFWSKDSTATVDSWLDGSFSRVCFWPAEAELNNLFRFQEEQAMYEEDETIQPDNTAPKSAAESETIFLRLRLGPIARRDSPSLAASVVGSVKLGEIIEVYSKYKDIGPNLRFAKLVTGEYVVVRSAGINYFDEVPPPET